MNKIINSDSSILSCCFEHITALLWFLSLLDPKTCFRVKNSCLYSSLFKKRYHLSFNFLTNFSSYTLQTFSSVPNSFKIRILNCASISCTRIIITSIVWILIQSPDVHNNGTISFYKTSTPQRTSVKKVK